MIRNLSMWCFYEWLYCEGSGSFKLIYYVSVCVGFIVYWSFSTSGLCSFFCFCIFHIVKMYRNVLCDCRCYFVTSWISWYFETLAAKKGPGKLKLAPKSGTTVLTFLTPFLRQEIQNTKKFMMSQSNTYSHKVTSSYNIFFYTSRYCK